MLWAAPILALPLVAFFFYWCCCRCWFPTAKVCGKFVFFFVLFAIVVSQITYWTYGGRRASGGNGGGNAFTPRETEPGHFIDHAL